MSIACPSCGRSWPKHPARAVPCPTSDATGTHHYDVVDDHQAEILAARFEGVFSPVDVRETLQDEPVEEALGLLEQASRARLPMKALRARAKEERLGYYRPKEERPDAAEEYGRYLAFVRRKQAESREGRGRSLSREDLDALTREFYAPMHRAELERIPAAAWEEISKELREEEEDAA